VLVMFCDSPVGAIKLLFGHLKQDDTQALAHRKRMPRRSVASSCRDESRYRIQRRGFCGTARATPISLLRDDFLVGRTGADDKTLFLPCRSPSIRDYEALDNCSNPPGAGKDSYAKAPRMTALLQ
jgi:hypothetical protein